MAARSRSKAGRAKHSPKCSARGGPSLSPQSTVHDEALTALSLERTEAFREALRPTDEAGLEGVSDRMVQALREVVHESYAIFDTLLDGLDLDPPIACKSGCIHCCYNQVALTEPEALVLGLHLLETRDSKRLADLSAKTEALVDSLKGKSWQDIGMARHRLPCLFLENGNCSVYPARPWACRGWNSVDVNMCLESNLSENALTLIENHPITRLIADSLQKGVLRGASDLGLEAGYLLMSRAVSLLLEDGAKKGVRNCMEDWLLGRPFFARKKSW